jgi:hypothetical protein
MSLLLFAKKSNKRVGNDALQLNVCKRETL